MTGAIMLGTISLNNMAGGLERNIIYLANRLVQIGHAVVLISFDFPDARSFFDIDPRVTWIKAGISKPHAAVSFNTRLQLIKNIRVAMKDYKTRQLVVFSHGILARFMAAGIGLGIRVICSERNALSMYSFIHQTKWNLNFLLLALTNTITVQFDAYRNDYPFWIRHKITVVHNPVFLPENQSDLSKPVMLAVGRLTAQKRFDMAIRSFAIYLKQHPEWRLRIVGDGPLKSELQELIETLGLSNSVTILPPNTKMEQHYAECSIFLSTSQWEGFPNALAEALSFGMLGVGFAQTKGVASLLEHGKNGVLADAEPSVTNMADALSEILGRQADWPLMSSNAKLLLETYSPEKWISAWHTILGPENCLNGKGLQQ